MCITDDCDNEDSRSNGIERRTFLTGATAAVVVGVTLVSERFAQGQQQPPTNALNDPDVIQGMVSFKSGADLIQGYLARPRKGGKFRAVVVLSVVVAFYAPPVLPDQFQAPNDRKRDLMDVVSQISVPMQGHYGTADAAIRVEDVRRFEAALRKQNMPAEFFFYEGARHAFCDYTRRNYNAEAATLAKGRMIAFLKRQFK
jgi:dienelactone hydrolase